MEMTEDQIVDLWDMFTNYIDSNKKEEAAQQFVNWCIDHGCQDDTLQAVADQDPYLGDAISEALDGEEIMDNYSDDDYDSDGDEW